MATIVIKDLPESLELDRQSMLAIAGGARIGARHGLAGRTLPSSTRIINYPATIGYQPTGYASELAARPTLLR